jgi:hypothetical protein
VRRPQTQALRPCSYALKTRAALSQAPTRPSHSPPNPQRGTGKADLANLLLMLLQPTTSRILDISNDVDCDHHDCLSIQSHCSEPFVNPLLHPRENGAPRLSARTRDPTLPVRPDQVSANFSTGVSASLQLRNCVYRALALCRACSTNPRPE